MQVLIIPDSHSKPGVSNKRYKALGRFIDDLQPEVIIQLGDWADMESLSSYDKGKKSFEGRRFQKDIDAANEALDLMEKEISYKPKKKIWLWGNHEERIDRAANDSPELEGILHKDLILAKEAGWDTVDMGETYDYAGYSLAHYFTSGVMGRPIGGLNHAQRLLQTQHCSCIQGHSHLWAYYELTKGNGQKIQAIVGGAFLDPNQREGYAKHTQKLWWNGLTLLHDVKNGYSDNISRVGMNTIMGYL